jgi:hypothetical protein
MRSVMAVLVSMAALKRPETVPVPRYGLRSDIHQEGPFPNEYSISPSTDPLRDRRYL